MVTGTDAENNDVENSSADTVSRPRAILGLLPTVKGRQKTRIDLIVEDWPVCLETMESFNWEVRKVYVSQCKNQKWFEHTPACEWIHHGRMQRRWKEGEIDVLVLVGGEGFVQKVIRDHDTTRVDVMVIVINGRNRLGSLSKLGRLKWRKFKHDQCGGVTNGLYWLGISFGWRDTVMAPQPRRVLRHIWDPTSRTRGKVVVFQDRDHEQRVIQIAPNVISVSGLLPWNTPLIRVQGPSVFKPKQEVQRRLLAKELAQVYDMSVVMSNQFGEWDKPSLHLPFIKTLPSKVWATMLESVTGRMTQRIEQTASILKDLKQGQEVLLPHMEVQNVQTDSKVNTPIPGPKSNVEGTRGRQQIVEGRLDGRDENEEDRNAKATKADDARIPVEMWDEEILNEFPHLELTREVQAAINILREWMLRKWRRNVFRSFCKYLHSNHGPNWISIESRNGDLVKDVEAGRDCLRRNSLATWFEWLGGSRPFFWRWPQSFVKEARDGIKVHFRHKELKWRKAQPPENNVVVRNQMEAKLRKVLKRGYIGSGPVTALTRFFSVPKGETDIRMVYDGSVSGLNDILWAPSFGLPTVDDLLYSVDHTSWLGDLDIGEQFLNFIAEPELQRFCGVDLTCYDLMDEDKVEEQPSKKINWKRWTRCPMGVKTSPYHACLNMLHWEQMLRGDRFDPSNPFQYETVELNLPGMRNYDPRVAKVRKLRKDGKLAGDIRTYVDDLRTSGSGEVEGKRVTKRTSQMCSYGGIQDASRKRRKVSQTPGAWSGSVIGVKEGNIIVTVEETKWLKTKMHLKELLDEVRRNPTAVDRKNLESKRGFLVYVARTYRSMKPHLKGIHLTIDSWRGDRDEDGWKNRVAVEIGEKFGYGGMFEDSKYTEAPKLVTPVPRYSRDLEALWFLCQAERPPERKVRSKDVYLARYGFGDASGTGFGSSFGDKDGVSYRYGVWGKDENKQSSNYRELANLVETLEVMVENGSIRNCELYLFTDNQVAERSFFNGTSTSKLLFQLILRLRKVEIEGGIHLILLHVSGKRMIQQGTDGLSRGSMNEGVMNKGSILDHVPLHVTSIETSPTLLGWIRYITGIKWIRPLKEEEWFSDAYGVAGGEENADGVWIPFYKSKTRLWVPPPAAAFVAIEQLYRARTLNQFQTHIFVCPKLHTHDWKRRLHRTADIVIEIPAITSFWKPNCFESLVVGFYFPYFRTEPWCHRGTQRMLELERTLRRMWKHQEKHAGSLLRKLFDTTRKMGSLSERLVRETLSNPLK